MPNKNRTDKRIAMLSIQDIKEYQNIIETFWPGELTSFNDDISEELEYTYCENNIHKIILDRETGTVSIGCSFLYDENSDAINPLENEKTYWLENAFKEFLDRHSEMKVCTWHDACYDLGYPGTDYEKWIGFNNRICTKSLIEEYLHIVELYNDRISSVEMAIEYLCSLYFKYSNPWDKINYWIGSRTIAADEVDLIYEGEEYCWCKVYNNVYICSVGTYRSIVTLLSNCTTTYKVLFGNNHLYFVSSLLSVELSMSIADRTILEIEQFYFQAKLEKSKLAIEQLYGDNAPRKSEETMKSERQLVKDIATACVRLLQNRLYFKQPENNRNDMLRDMLCMLGYDAKDQTRTGASASGISSGEADIMIEKSKLPYSFIEALNLERINSTSITEHIDRIYKYDKAGTSINFVVCYINTSEPEKFYFDYLKCISQKSTKYRKIEFETDLKGILDSPVANLRIIKESFIRNRSITDLYHLLVFFE